jgi:hypothetical protein
MITVNDTDKAETAPMLSVVPSTMPFGGMRSFGTARASDVRSRYVPIPPPVKSPGRFIQVVGNNTSADYLLRDNFDRPPSLFGAAYDFSSQVVTVGLSSPAASTSGTLTISTIISNTANTLLGWTEGLTTQDALLGYERYLTPNWDGYDADPITPATLSAARTFLGMLPRMFGEPDIAPGADGTIGLEWVFNDRPLRKFFIDIGPGGVWSGYWRRATGESEALPMSPIGPATKPFLGALFKKLNS